MKLYNLIIIDLDSIRLSDLTGYDNGANIHKVFHLQHKRIIRGSNGLSILWI